jgi:hypothetical protein
VIDAKSHKSDEDWRLSFSCVGEIERRTQAGCGSLLRSPPKQPRGVRQGASVTWTRAPRPDPSKRMAEMKRVGTTAFWHCHSPTSDSRRGPRPRTCCHRPLSTPQRPVCGRNERGGIETRRTRTARRRHRGASDGDSGGRRWPVLPVPMNGTESTHPEPHRRFRSPGPFLGRNLSAVDSSQVVFNRTTELTTSASDDPSPLSR